MSNTEFLLARVHQVVAISDDAVQRLMELDAKYAESPLENEDKRTTIAAVVTILNVQSSLIRHYAENDARVMEQLEALAEKITKK